MKKFIKITFGFLILVLIIICMILVFSGSKNNQTSDQNHCFRAAVYEHIRQGNPSNNKQAIHFNLKVYENVAQIAASQVILILIFFK